MAIPTYAIVGLMRLNFLSVIRAGMAVFRNLDQNPKDNAVFAVSQGKLVATAVEGVILLGSGRWLIDEAPGQVIPRLMQFFTP